MPQPSVRHCQPSIPGEASDEHEASILDEALLDGTPWYAQKRKLTPENGRPRSPQQHVAGKCIREAIKLAESEWGTSDGRHQPRFRELC